jgi:hypothetical protein
VYRILKHSMTHSQATFGGDEMKRSMDQTKKMKSVDYQLSIWKLLKSHSEADLVLTDDWFYCETSLARLLKGHSKQTEMVTYY